MKNTTKNVSVPYLNVIILICTLDDALNYRGIFGIFHHQPEQGSRFFIRLLELLSTAMYYTGLDPRDMSEVYVPKTPKEKAMQKGIDTIS